MTAEPEMSVDEVAAEIERFFAVLVEPGSTFEIRVPKFQHAKRVDAGYFDDIAKGARAAAVYCRRKATGVYVVLNPVPRELFARSPNKMEEWAPFATSDGDIKRRRWILLDFDAKRPTGISASDDEKAAASEAARLIREWLTESHGWPLPVEGDSGNGSHLLYHIDLPGDDGGLVERVIKAAARELESRGLAGPKIVVDESVFNPSRISKIFGTTARKGGDIPERPHRRSRLLSVPDPVEIVTTEKLEAVASLAPQAATVPQRPHESNGHGSGEYTSRLDVPKFLRRVGVGFKEKERRSANGWATFVLDECPFNSDHKAPDAAVMQSPDGAPAFKCLHASCAGNRWAEFKAAVGKPEPDDYDPPLPPREKKRTRAASTPTPPPADGGSPFLSIFHEEGRTDLGNAKRFERMHGENVRYCHTQKSWYVWDGRRWAEEQDGAIGRLANKVVDEVWESARSVRADLAREPLLWAASSAGSGRIEAMVKLARDLLPVRVEELNRDNMLLNCPNGTVDLRTGELRPHERSDFITTLCPTKFDDEAESWHWDQFLEAVFCERMDLVEWVKRHQGYALTGSTSEQILPIFTGPGGNGKSTFIDAWFDVIGDDYAGPVASDLLLDKKQAGHPTELADLFGKRFVVCSETGNGKWLNEDLVKKLTGTDKITARRLYENFWRFTPTHKLAIVTNCKPNVRNLDDALARRLKIVPFDRKFEGKARDKSMPDKLRREASGILAWAVRGCLEWQAMRGLGACEAVEFATDSYLTQQDVIGRFIDEACVLAPDAKVRGSAVFTALEGWCKDQGLTVPGSRKVGEYLADRFERRTSNGVWYCGLGLQA